MDVAYLAYFLANENFRHLRSGFVGFFRKISHLASVKIIRDLLLMLMVFRDMHSLIS